MLGTLTDRQLLWRGRRMRLRRDRLRSQHTATVDELRAIWQESQRRGLTSKEVAEHTGVSESRVRREWIA